MFGGEQRRFERSDCAFFLHRLDDLDDADRVLALTKGDFDLVNPNTGSAPIFRSRRDAEITTRMYREHPVLVRHGGDDASLGRRPDVRQWPVKYVTTFHMTNDSALFMTRAELEEQGWQPAALGRWRKVNDEALPLYVGRMIHQYDHRHASVTVSEDNLHVAAFGAALAAADKADASAVPTPHWVRRAAVPADQRRDWALGFRDIARATDVRTMIACVTPATAAGNTLPLLVEPRSARSASLLLANLNALAFDYLARQKAQTTHLNWYIVEQLPVIAPSRFDAPLPRAFASRMRDAGLMNGNQPRPTVADFVIPQVLALSYTAHDLAPFARDLGYVDAAGQVLPPIVWNAEDRRARIAALDALFFHLDEAAFGRFRTKEDVLADLRRIGDGRLLGN